MLRIPLLASQIKSEWLDKASLRRLLPDLDQQERSTEQIRYRQARNWERHSRLVGLGEWCPWIRRLYLNGKPVATQMMLCGVDHR